MASDLNLPIPPISRKTLDPRSPLTPNPIHAHTQGLLNNMTEYGTPEQIADLKSMMNPDSRYWQHRIYQQKKREFDKKMDARDKKWGQVFLPPIEHKGPLPRGIDGPPLKDRLGFIDQSGENRWHQPTMTPEEFEEYEKSLKDAINQVYNERPNIPPNDSAGHDVTYRDKDGRWRPRMRMRKP